MTNGERRATRNGYGQDIAVMKGGKVFTKESIDADFVTARDLSVSIYVICG